MAVNLYYNRIVQLNVSETVAPEPNRLQQTAAVVSMGGTTIPSGTTAFIASAADLDIYACPHYDISNASWGAGTATLTTTNPHGIPVGQTTQLQVYNCVPAAYNGLFTATAVSTTQLSYSIASNPGVMTGFGTLETGPQIWLEAFNAEWWAQGNSNTGYYIYETGTAVTADVYSSVATYLLSNPQTIYNWQFLPGMDADHANGYAFFLEFNALTALVKFYLPVTSTTYTLWNSSAILRNTFAMLQSPAAIAAVESTELDVTSFVHYMTAFVPSPTNKLPPSQYTYLNGVSAFTPLTQTNINNFLAGNINFVATGAEGGISNTILVPGKNLNGTPANVAYSVDWVQINLNTDISAAVINGSNNPEAPLYYNQDGINFLQQVAVTTANRAISSGLALGRVIVTALDGDAFANNVRLGLYAGSFVINAVPFASYVALSPSDYANGLYGGFSASYTPQYGFETIVFNLNVTQFA